MRDYRSKEITTLKKIPELVSAYQSAIAKIEAGYRMVGEAYNEITAAYGDDYAIYIKMNTRHTDAKEAIKEVRNEVKKKCWTSIIDRAGIRKVMGIKEKDKLSKRLDDPESLPEVTNEEVFQMLSDMQASASSMFEDAVREVFEFLRIYGREDKLKTNQKSRYALNKKVILHGVVNYWMGRLSIEYGYQTRDKIASVDRIFHVLDGNKIFDTGYISELVDAINTAENGSGETQYFRFRACKNGNLHLEFKRPDLVQKLNAIAGNTTELKGR